MPITAAPGPGNGNAGVGRFGSGGGTPGWADRVEGDVGPPRIRMRSPVRDEEETRRVKGMPIGPAWLIR